MVIVSGPFGRIHMLNVFFGMSPLKITCRADCISMNITDSSDFYYLGLLTLMDSLFYACADTLLQLIAHAKVKDIRAYKKFSHPTHKFPLAGFIDIQR